MKIKVGDKVLITVGKDRGREGKVVRALPRWRRVVVEGINVYKRHLKPRQTGQSGQIVERERPLPVANVALVCPKCKEQARVGYQFNREDRKVRVCGKCKSEIGGKS